ncbi:hypothetical protein DEO72_LG5g1552 [Vigna unguiculata]|uniref:Uncharacterized protein n=1 Tax=Vigna unguiculata TaxID=3917 RepID=A0A4D6LXQ5_VIGUN|nr:hypothetical protein DEO72_LG5g1552 [Vigna unguiculata]
MPLCYQPTRLDHSQVDHQSIYKTQQTSHQLKHQPRSSQEPSLRRKGSFAQAVGPRLGKTTNSEGCWNVNSRLGEVRRAPPRLIELSPRSKTRSLAWAENYSDEPKSSRVLA